ncbi:hypothetical protein BH10PSE12_BH10PSE12_27450 [soil metagenome]
MQDERQYVFDTIGAFLSGSSGRWDWDNFTSCSLMSPELDKIRHRAAALELPLDAESMSILKALLDEVEQFTGDDLLKPKPWRMEVGLYCGFAIGAVLWWFSFVSGGGLFQNLQIIVVPMALGVGIVSWRNRRAKIGFYDPAIIKRNKEGRT